MVSSMKLDLNLQADFLRNGTGRTILSLSEADSTQLWNGVKQHNLSRFNTINQKLLNPQGTNLRHIPVKLYLPQASIDDTQEEEPPAGAFRVVQALIAPSLSPREYFCSWKSRNTLLTKEAGSPQTVGTALNSILPSLFPSRRIPMLAQPVLHGAVLPLGANIEDLLRTSAYMDGWLHIVVAMLS